MKTLNQVIDKFETCNNCDYCGDCPYFDKNCPRDPDMLHYLKEYAEKKDELDEAIQKEKIEFFKAAEVVRVCTENLQEKIAKVTDYTEIVSGYEAEVGGKCGACGNWVYDELPYCPHCGKRLDWGEHE